MKYKSFILFFAGSLIALSCMLISCEKKFDPRDTYKDITIVYGLLDVVDSVHYLRINKAFLGNESAVIMAKDPDSSTYPPDEIDVKIYEELNGKITEISVDTITIHDKESGYFYYPNQLMYYFNKKFQPKSESTVKIEIKNKKTGKIIYGETPLVNTFFCYTPGLDLNPNNPTMNLTWFSAKNGKSYDAYYTFYYDEYRLDGSGSIRKDSVVWHMGTYTAEAVGNGESKIVFAFSPASFYTQLKKDIPYDENVRRTAYGTAKLAIWSGSEELYYYQSINKPSPGIVQEHPEYTNMSATLDDVNIENEAFGIFASRVFMVNPAFRLYPQMLSVYLPAIDRQFSPPS